MIKRHTHEESQFYLVGAGIASLAAAAFLIRDGGVRGSSITILQESAQLGGSMDAGGSPKDGYSMRGYRMFESKYLCTFELFSSIPTLDGTQTVTEETFAFNKMLKASAKARLVRGGKPIENPSFGLSEAHILAFERLLIEPEGLLGRTTIAEQFNPEFFQTDFWFMWCTTFAFQPWHSAVEFKRYLIRFLHMVSGFNTQSEILRTKYNQFDSLVRPLWKWLEERGVQIRYNCRVTELHQKQDSVGYAAHRILFEQEGLPVEIILRESDFVLVTLGSMTEGSAVGSNDHAPLLLNKKSGGAWSLWESIARDRIDCGNPANFTDHVDESKWVSFTTTLTDPTLFNFIRNLSGSVAGEGGAMTFADSNWLFTLGVPHQPHFLEQPEGVQVFWGYGLSVDKPGNFVKKPMSACSGKELMMEILGHLGMVDGVDEVLSASTCVPCMMPFITSQFLRRSPGDRPSVIPERSKNVAFMGQYCEIPHDVVFTVEYSIRSAQLAVYGLLGLELHPPPMYRGDHNLRVLLEAYSVLHATAVA